MRKTPRTKASSSNRALSRSGRKASRRSIGPAEYAGKKLFRRKTSRKGAVTCFLRPPFASAITEMDRSAA
jgi:hypothetical protein